MRITIDMENEDGDVFEYKGATDFFLAVRYPQPLSDGRALAAEFITETNSQTTGRIRDIVKEVRQGLFDLVEFHYVPQHTRSQ
jgi:hypothetical protein